MMIKSLDKLYAESDGRVSDKWSLYISEYDRLFGKYRESPVKLLEIGIQNGGSLEIWSHYFEQLKSAVGCDIDPEISKLKYENPNIKLVVGDAKLESTKNRILSLSDSFTIIIDDGSHHSRDIIGAFARYYPHLDNDGIYVIEDLHCSYWQEFKGGLFDPLSSMSFFKCLADVINHEHWGVEKERVEILHRFESEYGYEFHEEDLQSIHSIEFINSMCVIHKADPDKNLLGGRLFAGKIDDVAKCLDQNYPSEITVPAQTDNKWAVSTSSIEEELNRRTNELKLLKSEISEHEEQIRLLNEELQKYQTSASWKITRPMRFSRRVVGRAFHRVDNIIKRQKDFVKSYKTNHKQQWDYASWIKKRETLTGNQNDRQEAVNQLSYQPQISILLPVYKIDRKMFQHTIESVLAQSYQNWQLCIAFAYPEDQKLSDYIDSITSSHERISTTVIEQNEGISANSNASLKLATGEFIALLDHDDVLAPSALFEIVKFLNENPDHDFLYSDKDCIDETGSQRLNALFKPEWSPEMMYSVNYLTHFNVIRRSIVEQIGGFRSETDGAQDWDLFLRVSQVTDKITRVPGVSYHWRIHLGSTSTGIEAKPYAVAAQLKTVQDHIIAQGLSATVELNNDSGFRIVWDEKPQTTIDLIIDAQHKNSKRLNRIIEKYLSQDTSYHLNFICIIPEDFHWEYSDRITYSQSSISIVRYSGEENRTSAIFDGVKQGRGECLIFTSGDVDDFNEICVSELAGWTVNHPEICFTSSLVLDSNQHVIESGLIVDKHDRGTPLFKGSILRNWGWFGGPLWFRNCSASSPWMVAVSRADYEAVGGGDSSLEFDQAFIRLCRQMRQLGKRGLVNPHVKVIVHEQPEKLIPPYDESITSDPYFHPYFSSVHPLELKQ